MFSCEIFVTDKELADAQAESIDQGISEQCYDDMFMVTAGGLIYRRKGLRFDWDPASTYVRLPPYFEGLKRKRKLFKTLLMPGLGSFGDSVTADHISPLIQLRRMVRLKISESQGVTRENSNSLVPGGTES